MFLFPIKSLYIFSDYPLFLTFKTLLALFFFHKKILFTSY